MINIFKSSNDDIGFAPLPLMRLVMIFVSITGLICFFWGDTVSFTFG